jgi:alkylhydroperoxidase/carboxymuconolactone decarboxylase family protein YurZ
MMDWRDPFGLNPIREALARVERVVSRIVADHDDDSRLAAATKLLAKRTQALADAVSGAKRFLTRKERVMANPVVQQTIDQVSRTNQVIASAIVLISGIKDMIAKAVQEAIQNGATAEELAPVSGLILTLGEESNTLAEAVAANTPAQP